MLKGHGLTVDQALIISLIVMGIKLVLDVFFIRVVLRFFGVFWRRYIWRNLKVFFRRHNILFIENLYHNHNSKAFEATSFLGRFSIAYQKPIDAMAKLRDRLVNWAIGVGSLAVFVLAVVPMPPIIAAAAVLSYITLTIKQPWYRFNNLFFVSLFLGSEIKIIVIISGIYG
ncbi:MAG: hypothetical protein HY973_02200 [Candidatus Kerfeldbacteria bacterium]|nr:hypothetical protein [Candidatus Kerfeldbacteria bacterium]